MFKLNFKNVLCDIHRYTVCSSRTVVHAVSIWTLHEMRISWWTPYNNHATSDYTREKTLLLRCGRVNITKNVLMSFPFIGATTIKVPWSELHFPITKCISKCNSEHGNLRMITRTINVLA